MKLDLSTDFLRGAHPMKLDLSTDEGNTWNEYRPELIDFEQHPATLLRFVETCYDDLDNTGNTEP
jgi:hypothetical protein